MPLWPFGRKKRRTSNSSQAATSATSDACNEKTRVLDPRRDMTSPTQTSAWPQSRRESQRKRKVATGGSDATPTMDEKHADPPPRNTSVQDITALPGVPEVESSPHLRPVKPHKAVVSYNLDRATVSSPSHDHSTSGPPAIRSHQATRTQAPQRGRSIRRRDDSREDHIQIMTSSIQTPKRPAGANHDLLRRDSKKARRTLQKPRPDDHRASTVSLPLSVPSAMSARSEERGWAVGIIDVLSPRPTVRLSVPGCYPQDGSNTGLSHKGSKKGGKLPAIAQVSSKKDRRRVADLADDLDSSDLRTVLERDARRQEQKATQQQERLERKLRKRAEKQRAEEETEREREQREREREHEQKQKQEQEQGQKQEHERIALERAPPTAVHPAFRDQGPDEHALTGLSTPKPRREDGMNNESLPRGGTYLNYPAHQDIPQNPFDDPEHEHSPFADPVPEPSSATTERWSPVQTPLDEPVLETARFVRLSQGHISPPASPSPTAQPAGSLSESSDLQSQRTTSIPRPLAQSQRRVSESSSRRTGTWASFFRRGPSASRTSVDYAARPNASEASFTNVSRESMSRQPQQNIPAHLIEQSASASRSRTPARTQSRFHEDLPDAPMSPPDSRVHSPELSTVAANVASALRGKRAAQQMDLSSSSEPMNVGRTDSPVIPEEVPLSHSLASIDSEGSWISGRPVHRRSTTRVQRESTASVVSADGPNDDFTGSYERLPIPEHEFFSALTSNAASQRTSSEVPDSVGLSTTSAAAQIGADSSNTGADTPLRHGTAHRRPTVVHNEPRFKSREGLVGEFMAGSAAIPSRASSVSELESPGTSPIEQATLQKASSVNYGHGKSLSAGSARLLNIRSSRHGSNRTSPAGSPALQQSEFEKTE